MKSLGSCQGASKSTCWGLQVQADNETPHQIPRLMGESQSLSWQNHQNMKQEKPAFMLPVMTRTNKKRQGLNLYGCFIRKASDLRRWRVCTLTDCLKFHFKLTFFMRRRKVQVRGLEFREKVNQIKSCSILSSVPWAVGVSPWSTMAQIPS